MKAEDKKKLLYNYKIEMMESKHCFPIVFQDNSFKAVITIDEALRILNKMISAEDE